MSNVLKWPVDLAPLEQREDLRVVFALKAMFAFDDADYGKAADYISNLNAEISYLPTGTADKTKYLSKLLAHIFDTAKSYLDNGLYEDANQAIRLVPEHVDIDDHQRFIIARTQYELEKNSAALSSLEQISDAAPQHYALKIVALSALLEWDQVNILLADHYNSSGDMDWVIDRIFGNIHDLLDNENYDDALLAIRAIEPVSPLPFRHRFTFARACYEAGDLVKAKSVLGQMPMSEPKHYALLMAVYAGLFEWNELAQIWQDQFNPSGQMDWVVDRVYGEILGLIDRRAYDEAHKGVKTVTALIEIPDRLKFSLARIYYEAKDFGKAKSVLESAPHQRSCHQALHMAMLVGQRDWQSLQKSMQAEYDVSSDMEWVIDRIYGEVEELVAADDFLQAQLALSTIPESAEIPKNKQFLTARIHYETAELSKARIVLDELLLDAQDNEQYDALNLAVMAGQHDWPRLQAAMETQFIPSGEMDWVVDRTFAEIKILIEIADFPEARDAIDVLPESVEVPEDLRFDIARAYYETSDIVAAKFSIENIIADKPSDPKFHALHMAVLARAHDWTSLKPIIKTHYNSSNNMDWIVERILCEVEQFVDQADFDQAISAVKVLPVGIEVPERFKFTLARVFYEAENLEAAILTLQSQQPATDSDPKVQALNMAVLAGLKDWPGLGSALTKDFDTSGDMDWVLDRIYREIDILVDEEVYTEAMSAIEVIPQNIDVPDQHKFTSARVYYEAGAYDQAGLILSEISQNEPQINALQMAVLAGQRDWAGLESALQTEYDPSGDMDWVLERVFAEIAKIESADLQKTAIRLETLLIDNFFEQAPYKVKIRLLSALTQARQYGMVLELASNLRRERPDDSKLLIISARAAYLRRNWDVDMEIFADFIKRIDPSHFLYPKVANALEAIDLINTSSTLSSEDVDGRITDRLFDVFFRSNATKSYEPAAPNKVALIGANMAAGGAEHVLINAHLGLIDDPQIDNNLWLHNIDSHLNHDHFLKQYNVELGDGSKTYLMKPIFETQKPFNLIEGYIGYQSNRIYKQIMAEKPAVIHAWQDSTNIECAFAGIEAGVPKIILHPHNMRPDLVHKTNIAKSFWACYRALLSRDDVHLVCCSQASLDDYLGWLDMDATDKCHVVYNGFKWSDEPLEDQKTFSRAFLSDELGIDPSLKIVCGVFRLNEVKRPLLWAETARRVLQDRDDVAFVIYGDGAYMQDLKMFIKDHDLGDRFHLPGRVQNASKYSADCDVLLQTSRTEGLPTVLIEAMTNGIPVVASNVGGSKECFAGEHPDMFKLVDSSDPEVFASELNKMLDCQFDDHQTLDLSRATKKKFGVKAMVDGLTQIYNQD